MTWRAKPSWLLLLIGTPFLAGGGVVGYFGASGLVQGFAMRTWQEVPARILTAELHSHRGSKGGATYSVEATYEYEFEGRTYRGDRVAVHGGSDNIGSFQQDAAAELEGYRDRGEPFRAFVNPLHPDQAVLYRELRIGLLAFLGLFFVLFGGIGGFLILGAFVGLQDGKSYRPARRNRKP